MRLEGQCAGCLIPINESNTYKQSNGSIALYCKKCHNERSRRAMNAYRTGLSIDEYDAAMEKAGHRCQVCGARQCGIDQDSRGKVRGVLCLMCRNVVSYYRDGDIMAKVAAYCG